jgi:collagenase-like PrtC family protease
MQMTNSQDEKRMKITLATNFDPLLVEEIRKSDKEHLVTSVYGKLADDVLGGGRASMFVPKVSMNRLRDYVALCHNNGIKFNYLLNPTCLGNREVNPQTNRKLISLFHQLMEIGVDAVTVTSPYLCQVIKKQFPGFRVSIGLYAYISDLQQARYWRELGADEITLQHSLNRNLGLLEALLRSTRNLNLGVRLIANHVCLHECPFRFNHSMGMGHASQKGHPSNGKYIDYNLLTCNYQRLRNPVKFISSDWIRPEDLGAYDALCRKTGNYNLSIKLTDRTKTTAFLTRVLKAYIDRSYDGNLTELLNCVTRGNTSTVTGAANKTPANVAVVAEGTSKRVGLSNEEQARRFSRAFLMPDIYIDNKKLDGFLEGLVRHCEYDKKACSDIGWTDSSKSGSQKDNQMCSYCRMWAERAISFDEAAHRNWMAMANSTLDDLKMSKMFL